MPHVSKWSLSYFFPHLYSKLNCIIVQNKFATKDAYYWTLCLKKKSRKKKEESYVHTHNKTILIFKILDLQICLTSFYNETD
jgi:hypothetical protein